MFYIFIMCGGFWVCNRAAVVDGGGAFGCPHIVASRQWGVIEIVTARAVNIAGNFGCLRWGISYVLGRYKNCNRSRG